MATNNLFHIYVTITVCHFGVFENWHLGKHPLIIRLKENNLNLLGIMRFHLLPRLSRMDAMVVKFYVWGLFSVFVCCAYTTIKIIIHFSTIKMIKNNKSTLMPITMTMISIFLSCNTIS